MYMCHENGHGLKYHVQISFSVSEKILRETWRQTVGPQNEIANFSVPHLSCTQLFLLFNNTHTHTLLPKRHKAIPTAALSHCYLHTLSKTHSEMSTAELLHKHTMWWLNHVSIHNECFKNTLQYKGIITMKSPFIAVVRYTLIDECSDEISTTGFTTKQDLQQY